MSKWPYSTARWQRLRRTHLDQFPQCEGCQAMGILRAAAAVDHRVSINSGGHPFPSHDGLASYCWACHSAKTARGAEAGAIKTTKARRGCAADGTPLDIAHEWNGGDGRLSKAARDRRLPSDIMPSRIPITIVCGPPASGKSSYVREHAGSCDLIICLDTIMSGMTALPEHHASRRLIPRALDARNIMLRGLATDEMHSAAWFIVTGEKHDERAWWQAKLGGDLIVIATPLDECVRRIEADAGRAPARERMILAARRWWHLNAGEKSLRADAAGPPSPHNLELVRFGEGRRDG